MSATSEDRGHGCGEERDELRAAPRTRARSTPRAGGVVPDAAVADGTKHRPDRDEEERIGEVLAHLEAV